MRVLLAAFEPFGGETVNPSIPATALVAGAPPDGVVLRRLVLPVTYARAWPDLRRALDDHPPDLLLLTGLAGGRAGLSFERLAVNLDDGPIPDNDGEQRVDTPVVAEAPAAYFTTAPIKAMAAAARDAGVEAALSNSAGTFLCNHVLYRACHHAATATPGLRCGFVHLPWLPEQAVSHRDGPHLPVEAMATGLRAALAAAVRSRSGGARGG